MISGRRRSVIFFTVLGICLVALAVTLNVSWVVLNWQQRRARGARRHLLPAHHRRDGAQHHLPGPRDPPERAARLVHQRRHPRAQDAGRLDPALPADAADPRARRGEAARVLPHHARGQRPAAAHDRAGAARRQHRLAAAARRSARTRVDLAELVARVRRRSRARASTSTATRWPTSSASTARRASSSATPTS